MTFKCVCYTTASFPGLYFYGNVEEQWNDQKAGNHIHEREERRADSHEI